MSYRQLDASQIVKTLHRLEQRIDERFPNYCSEMLSLTNKLAAVYAQHLPDSVVIEAVNDIETLTTNLSGKIWQKITIIDTAKTPPRSP